MSIDTGGMSQTEARGSGHLGGRTAEVTKSIKEDKVRESRRLSELSPCHSPASRGLEAAPGRSLRVHSQQLQEGPPGSQCPLPTPCTHCRLAGRGEQSRPFLFSGSAKSHDKRWCDLAGFPEWHNLPEGVFLLCTG